MIVGLTGGIGANIRRPAEFIHVNLSIQDNVFEAARKYGRMVQVGTQPQVNAAAAPYFYLTVNVMVSEMVVPPWTMLNTSSSIQVDSGAVYALAFRFGFQ